LCLEFIESCGFCIFLLRVELFIGYRNYRSFRFIWVLDYDAELLTDLRGIGISEADRNGLSAEIFRSIWRKLETWSCTIVFYERW
jgi:hypothetical protein